MDVILAVEEEGGGAGFPHLLEVNCRVCDIHICIPAHVAMFYHTLFYCYLFILIYL